MASELTREQVAALQHLWYGHENVPRRSDFVHAWRAVKSVGACDGQLTDTELLYLLGKMCAIGTPSDVVDEIMAFDEHSGTPEELVAGIDVPEAVRWVACQAFHSPTVAEQVPDDRPALAARGAAYDDRSRFATCHPSSSAGIRSRNSRNRRRTEQLRLTVGSLARVSFPTPDMTLSHILVVADVDVSRHWYTEVLGAQLYREYGGNSAVLSFNGAWLLLVTGGAPTSDKPSVSLAPPADPDRLDHLFTIRVPDCREAYQTLLARGAEFITPPVDHGPETRCFFRDPDGHLFEISEYRREGGT